METRILQRDFPKILILGYFNQSKPVGITINNMFKLWPQENLAVASFNSIREMYSPICKRYYCLGRSEIKYRFPLNYTHSVPISAVYNDFNLDNTNIQKPKIIRKYYKSKIIINRFYNRILFITGLNLNKYKYFVSNQFSSWLNEFNPDYIYCTVEDISRIKFILKVQKKTKKKIIIHIMDDWIHTAHLNTVLPFIWKRSLNRNFKQLIQLSSINFTISEKMAKEYTKKYDVLFYPFHNPIDPTKWKHNSLKGDKDKFLFVYTGKIGKDHAQAINQFINVINKPAYKDKIDLQLYSTTDITKVTRYLSIRNTERYFCGSLEYDMVPKALSYADALFLPLSFSKKSCLYTRLSMPTKVTEYMGTNKPIFCYTPEETAVSEYLRTYKAAFLTHKKCFLESSINLFINNYVLRKEMASNGIELVKENHDFYKNTIKMLDIFMKFF